MLRLIFIDDRAQTAKIEEIAANFTNGVLEIIVPIPEVKPKSINIPVFEAAKAKNAPSPEVH